MGVQRRGQTWGTVIIVSQTFLSTPHPPLHNKEALCWFISAPEHTQMNKLLFTCHFWSPKLFPMVVSRCKERKVILYVIFFTKIEAILYARFYYLCVYLYINIATWHIFITSYRICHYWVQTKSTIACEKCTFLLPRIHFLSWEQKYTVKEIHLLTCFLPTSNLFSTEKPERILKAQVSFPASNPPLAPSCPSGNSKIL